MGIKREDAEPFKISDVTTNSLEAFGHYQKGIAYLWRFQSSEAREELEKAVEIDPDFAAAYVYLSIAQTYLSSVWSPYTDLSQSKKILERADQLSYKILDKEKKMIELQKAMYGRDYEKYKDILSFDKVDLRKSSIPHPEIKTEELEKLIRGFNRKFNRGLIYRNPKLFIKKYMGTLMRKPSFGLMKNIFNRQ